MAAKTTLMFFFFAKILEFFIYPVTWILLLMTLGFLIKKTTLRRKLFISAFAVLVIFTNPFLLNRFALGWDVRENGVKRGGKYSCAIVLGGLAGGIKSDTGFFNWSADRFIQALKLYETGQVSHILISGGNGDLIHGSFQEADWVKKQLRLFNVPDSCVLAENKSRNTLENAAFTKVILQKSELKPPFVLVTSGFHMRRSLGIFKKENIPVVPYPCNYITGTGKVSITDFIPDGGTLATWGIYTKEALGFMVNKLR